MKRTYLHLAILAALAAPVVAVENVLDATYNATLTTYATGLAQGALEKSLINFLAPIVPTGGADSGQYKNFVNADSLRTYSLATNAGSRERIAFDAADPYFNLVPIGLETLVTEREARQPGNVAQRKIKQLMNSFFLSREVKGIAALRSGLTATSGLGAFLTDDAVDPIQHIDQEILRISDSNGGMMPNRMVMPLRVWNRLRNHPLVKSRLSGISTALSSEQLKGLFLNPNIDVRFGTLSYETSARGKTAAKTSVYGLDLWTFYAADAPDESDVSAFKTFADGNTIANTVREYVEKGNNTIYFVEGAEQIIVTAPISASRITVS